MNIIKNQLTFAETLQFVNGIIDSVFVQDSEGNDIDYSPATLQPLINSTFVEMYTDYEFTEDFDKNFAVYMTIDIDKYIESTEVNWMQLKGMLKAIENGVEYRKQKLLDSQSKQSEMYSAITALLSTLNSKAEQLDMKKLEKQLKKLNASEIMKAYQKSGIGDGVRDNAIKDLKNQISARNVKTDKTVGE